MKDVVTLILGGGQGNRLLPLTKFRSKPAVPLAGKYRLIDIPISNCLNSGLNRLYVLTQFLSVSLHQHIGRSYHFDQFGGGFVEVLAAQQTMKSTHWYQGTADAIRQQINYVNRPDIQDALILSGDQLYRMNYQELIKTHREKHADVTIAVIPVHQAEVSALGIMKLDDNGRVSSFIEKPKSPELQDQYRTPTSWIDQQGIRSQGREYLASMGIYVFQKDVLVNLLETHSEHTDFGKHVIPYAIDRLHVQAHLFDGYWEDVGTIKAYHRANLELVDENPRFDFNDPNGPIYTNRRFLPASRISGAKVDRCLISDGCMVEEGASLRKCIVGIRSHIGRNVTLEHSIFSGADFIETPAERSLNEARKIPNVGIGADCIIRNTIIDKNARIGNHVCILPDWQETVTPKDDFDHEKGMYFIRDGIVVIPKDVVIPDGTRIE